MDEAFDPLREAFEMYALRKRCSNDGSQESRRATA